MTVLQFPAPTSSVKQTATSASTLDMMYHAFSQASNTDSTLALVLDKAEKYGWNQELTVMMSLHTLAMRSPELQAFIIDLLKPRTKAVELQMPLPQD